MNPNNYASLAAILLAGSLATSTTPARAQIVDCRFDFTIAYGCAEDGTGWATVTNINGKENTYSIHWDYNEAAGGPNIIGLSNGPHTISIFDIDGCDVTQTFTIDCTPGDDGGCHFRTQTQGGWGTNAHGNNPGVYRDANFAAAFPNGLQIGCTNKLRLTTSAAVKAFLPSGTTARALNPGTLTNPGNSYRNVLAGQLVALTLSVGFDANDAAFGGSNTSLGNALLLNGTFQGWTVQMLLNEANRFIGGCGSSYSASQLNAALSMVNENYVDGTTDNGNVGCAKGRIPSVAKSTGSVISVFPNPASEILTAHVIAKKGGPVSVRVMNTMGTTVLPVAQAMMMRGEERKFIIDVSSLANGTYLVAVAQEDGNFVTRVVVSH